MRRVARIDALRGLAIISVVIGHALHRHLGPQTGAFQFLASFEMPLFAFVSGYLTMRPVSNSVRWLGSKSLRVLVPFLAWAPVMWLMSRFAFSGMEVLHIPNGLLDYLLVLFPHPERGLWYLFTLFQWCLVITVMSAIPASTKFGSLISLATSTVVVLAFMVALKRCIPFGDFGLVYYVELVPFFAAGFISRAFGIHIGEQLSVRYLMLGAFALTADIILLVITAQTRISNAYPKALDAVSAAIGVAGMVLVFRALKDESPLMRVFSAAGRSSIGIYAIHLLFLGVGLGTGWLRVFTTVVTGLSLSLVGTWLLRLNQVTARLLLGEYPRRA